MLSRALVAVPAPRRVLRIEVIDLRHAKGVAPLPRDLGPRREGVDRGRAKSPIRLGCVANRYPLERPGNPTHR